MKFWLTAISMFLFTSGTVRAESGRRSLDLGSGGFGGVLGAGGEIKLRGDSAIEQRLRLEAEGVRFRGRKVNMKAHEWKFRKKRS